MKVILEHEESEEMFFNAMCNALSYMGGYGLTIDYDDAAYESAKKRLQEKSPNEIVCFEDVLMEILRSGGTLTMKDEEGDGDMTRSITLNDVHERVQKTPIRQLIDMYTQNDDGDTADNILQTVFFEEIVFG